MPRSNLSFCSLNLVDNLDPIWAPANAPIDSNMAGTYWGFPSIICVDNPTKDVIMSINCEVGAAKYIVNPRIIIIKGTNTTPPPIPNKLEMIPATNALEKKRILTHMFWNDKEFPASIDFL